ncbi:MAG: hypothetical protein LQ347_000531 [Umbilicaria vellea]|nr:MAG: hypothetical protein LQ347_000531 [Umbilicaria vellea]
MTESNMEEELLHVTIRFTASIPDLQLKIAAPATTTSVALKRQIRSHLPPNLSNKRLRLIYSGKVIPDVATLTNALHLLPPPPFPPSNLSKGNGKGISPLARQQTFYIHCSISDGLTTEELAAEAALASSTAPISTQSLLSHDGTPAAAADTTSTTSAPRGFDRLLSAGFTPLEIASLRSQFLAIQAHIHTPDTMPSASELRTLEDRWIDDTNGAAPAVGSEGGAGLGDDAEGDGGGLDDMLWGNIIGFFWPIGAVLWLLREEGVWSKRRQIAVVTGMLINIAFSVFRVSN